MSRRRVPRPEWAAIDVELFDDIKVAQLKPADQLAFIRAVLWTTKMLTDGLIPKGGLTLVGISQAQASRMLEVGLFEHDDAGYHLVAWDKWQKPRAEWESTYRAKVEGGRRSAHLRWHKSPDLSCDYCLEGIDNVRDIR